jgi:nucleoside diphosphate kinase
MFVPKAKRVVVIEETFVLLKPDAVGSHQAILDIFANSGLMLTCRTMPRTRPLIAGIVRRYNQDEMLRLRERRASGASNAATDAGGSMYAAGSPYASFAYSDFQSAAERSGDLPSAGPSVGPSSFRGAPPAGSQRRRYSLDGIAAGPAVYTAEDHEDFLLKGTCLAVVLSAPNAVSEVLRLCGPENPAAAKRTAPESIRAVFGTDTLKNAVFCAPTHDAAAALISAVFKYETEAKTEVVQERRARGGGGGAGGNGGSGDGRDHGVGDYDMLPTMGEEFLAVQDLAPAQVEEARQQVLDDRASLKQEADLLRVRELDLLEREATLRRQLMATSDTNAAGGQTLAPTQASLRARFLANTRMPAMTCELRRLEAQLAEVRGTIADWVSECDAAGVDDPRARDVSLLEETAEQLGAKIAAAEADVARMRADIAGKQAEPQFVSLSRRAALQNMSLADVGELVLNPHRMLGAFRDLDSRDAGTVLKDDFVDFYNACTAFKDLKVSSARVDPGLASLLAKQRATGADTLSLDEFSVVMMALHRR